jgi:hypothetical protein
MTHQRSASCPGFLCQATVWAVLAVALPCHAQEGGKWEIELHGGAGMPTVSTNGTSALPPPGPTFLTARPYSDISRRVPSWYFGDGAMLINQVLAEVSLTQTIAPLDAVVTRNLVDSKAAGSAGFRVSRVITPRFSAELSVDYQDGGFVLSPAGRAGIEASRASFINVWNLIAREVAFNPSTVPAPTSIATLNDGHGTQLFTTGSVVVNLRTSGRLIPYVTAGAGMLTNRDDWPSATLVGNYRFSMPALNIVPPNRLVFNTIPINETDTVTIQATRDKHAFAGVVGGGLKYSFARHRGVRGDARVYLSKYTSRVVVSTTPSVAAGSPAGAAVLFSVPDIQFSNNPSFGPSTLSHSVTGFETFSGSSVQSTTQVTAGVFFRF